MAEERTGLNMAKLIAFYSRADENYFGGSKKYIKVGNTEKAANMIAELTGADLFKIEQKIPYAADYDTCIAQAKKDKQENARPELSDTVDNISEYDRDRCWSDFHGDCKTCWSRQKNRHG